MECIKLKSPKTLKLSEFLNWFFFILSQSKYFHLTFHVNLLLDFKTWICFKAYRKWKGHHKCLYGHWHKPCFIAPSPARINEISLESTMWCAPSSNTNRTPDTLWPVRGPFSHASLKPYRKHKERKKLRIRRKSKREKEKEKERKKKKAAQRLWEQTVKIRWICP